MQLLYLTVAVVRKPAEVRTAVTNSFTEEGKNQMKKMTAMLLVLLMVLAIIACGKEDDKKDSDKKDDKKTEVTPTKKADDKKDDKKDTEKKYTFPGYTENGTWPDAATWAGMGLPELKVDDAGKVTINTKSYIYPLNAKDGVMFDCHPETSHFEDLVKTLENAGFVEAEVDTVGDNVWASDYKLEGEPMRITITETDAGRLIVFIQYQPE